MNMTERNDDIVRLRNVGETMEFIGDKHGLTRQRVSMILDDRGVAPLPPKPKKVKYVSPWPTDAEMRDSRDKSIAFNYEHRVMTIKQMAKMHGLSITRIQDIMLKQGRQAKTIKAERNAEIRAHLRAGVSVKTLAAMYEVSAATISYAKLEGGRGNVGTPARA